ncbi:MAG: methylated-DNA--[protein]-cysteine S-methyltransferase [Rothia sp. (in: high G+C Gram-positive bacteria)]|nr:methylated-DNA--[protein]-cysteine S-methyltransferase [Rothia sp. (in: high G+C Gram-positive bacteria)]
MDARVQQAKPEDSGPEPQQKIWHSTHPTPLGKIYLASNGSALTGAWLEGQLHFASAKELGCYQNLEDQPLLSQAARELDQYFSRQRTSFDLPIQPTGTDFQLAVWALLKEIPYGFTSTYGAIAGIVGPHAPAQAVGQAVGRNKCLIFIPCHRVIAANGSLSGFSAGIDKKKYLLNLEKPAATRANRLF